MWSYIFDKIKISLFYNKIVKFLFCQIYMPIKFLLVYNLSSTLTFGIIFSKFFLSNITFITWSVIKLTYINFPWQVLLVKQKLNMLLFHSIFWWGVIIFVAQIDKLWILFVQSDKFRGRSFIWLFKSQN